jgi:alpha-1,2-glucosyltransferase
MSSPNETQVGASSHLLCVQDEVFHIPQAQKYCNNDFANWDPKITTPPGLYVITYILKPIFGCDVGGTRATNVVCMIALAWIVEKIFTQRMGGGQEARHGAFLSSHSALNIALLPPLFFFSALYYTDVASTLSVMLCFYPLICSDESNVKQIWWHLRLFVLGLVSLSFRQTNIFWVAVFPAAATALRELDQGHELVKESMYNKSKGFGDTLGSVFKTTWRMEVLYDPPVRDASMEGMFCAQHLKFNKSLLSVQTMLKLLFPSSRAR